MENERQWQPPKLSDIKYSKISEGHKRHQEQREKNRFNKKIGQRRAWKD